MRVVLPTLMATLRARYPELLIEVEDLEGEQSLEAVRLGRVDVASSTTSAGTPGSGATAST